ncbi:hypothetical protein [Halobellus marinus]|uniref:hypothetical protein n=1 Tax=Halobellus TaxID=1073986 RepID=UPI0028AE1B9B|nr:hypothetical protein [Halobellus sp. DFY28]
MTGGKKSGERLLCRDHDTPHDRQRPLPETLPVPLWLGSRSVDPIRHIDDGRE